MQINCVNNLTFGKTLLGTTDIRKTFGTKGSLSFVEYSPNDEEDFEHIMGLKSLWGEDAEQLSGITDRFEDLHFNNTPKIQDLLAFRFFGLEDKRGNTLVVAGTVEEKARPKEHMKITFIQADPSQMYTAKNKLYSGLGESLVSKILEKAKDEDKKLVETTPANAHFWYNSGLFKTTNGSIRMAYIEKSDYDNYIKFVEDKKSTPAVDFKA